MQFLKLLKLGGSLITDKSTPYAARFEVMQRLAKEIAFAWQAESFSLIIGNGAGSFAHTSASEYGIKDGFHDAAGQLGFCQVQQDAVKLQRLLIDALLEQGLPVVGVSPLTFFKAKAGTIVEERYELLESLLEQHFIPVVHGDAILDQGQGSTIVSTDLVLARLAQNFHALNFSSELISVGKYAGVLDQQGKIIPLITPENFSDYSSALGGSEHRDVTGGMAAKVEELLALARQGIASRIINGVVIGRLQAALQGDDVEGTRIGQ